MGEQEKPEYSGEDQPREQARPAAAAQGDPRQGGAGVGGSSSAGNREGRHSSSGARRRHRDSRSEGQPPYQQPSRRLEGELNMEELRELLSLIAAQGFTEFELEKEGFRIRLSRHLASPPPTSATSAGAGQPHQQATPPTGSASPAATTGESAAAGASATLTGAGVAASSPAPMPSTSPTPVVSDEADLHKITSPIVGTFYRSPSPTAAPFVRAGSNVEADSVVCIIEAMKLMNVIQAEVVGVVEKIYVEDGQPVEYGQPLFGVRK